MNLTANVIHLSNNNQNRTTLNITLSSSGMQQLLNICQSYAIIHQLLYNGSKSFTLNFKNKAIKIKYP